MKLSELGQVIDVEWTMLLQKFPYIGLETHVIMPNHFHGILNMYEENAASLRTIIGTFKSRVTRKRPAEFSTKIWQDGYYEHIIRNERDFNAIKEYIYRKAENWADDEYFGIRSENFE